MIFGSNNGQITRITDNTGTEEAGRTVDYSYDPLGRLQTAVTVGSASYAQWGLAWSYDRYGNRTAQNVTAGSVPAPQLSFDPATNRITSAGYSYDAAGNMTVLAGNWLGGVPDVFYALPSAVGLLFPVGDPLPPVGDRVALGVVHRDFVGADHVAQIARHCKNRPRARLKPASISSRYEPVRSDQELPV